MAASTHGEEQGQAQGTRGNIAFENRVRAAMVFAYPAEGIYQDSLLWSLERLQEEGIHGTLQFLAPQVSTPSAQGMSQNNTAHTQTKLTEKKQAHQPKCPHCQEEMDCIEKQDRPKWRELFYGPAHPQWYEWTSQGLCFPSDDGPEPLIEPETKEALSIDIFDQQIALDHQIASHDYDP